MIIQLRIKINIKNWMNPRNTLKLMKIKLSSRRKKARNQKKMNRKNNKIVLKLNRKMI